MIKIRRALFSVTDKTGIGDFARGLADHRVALISTGGTATALRSAGLGVTDVSVVTGFPEMMDGRVKTLHPMVHGGLLARRDLESHRDAMSQHGIVGIDLLCVNLYAFEATVAKAGCTREDAVENIDIGGPAMVRSAAKNHKFVAVVTSPAQYDKVLRLLAEHEGHLPEEFLEELAKAAFLMTARYDAAIAMYLAGCDASGFPFVELPMFRHVRSLRYGENPHQDAALYAEPGASGPSIATAEFLGEGGKVLSHNNVLDLDEALRVVREFGDPFCTVIKHTNPCGAALAASAGEAWLRAQAGDPTSAFGSVVGFNVLVGADTASAIAKPHNFVECILAPDFTPEAVEILTTATKWGKNLRLVRIPNLLEGLRWQRSFRRIFGGMLIQDYDQDDLGSQLRTVTTRAPSDHELSDLGFAWRIAKHVTSNAIVLVNDHQVVGVGAGQMSRVDAAKIAVDKAGERANGAVVASDAFFPFPDGLQVCLDAGVTAAIQPGGSLRDSEVIALANARNAAMVFTGIRHFRH
jgi:phosphoribosylaminoimidazolecarboxamide formyltransferase / IMP cyclohydrolase